MSEQLQAPPSLGSTIEQDDFTSEQDTGFSTKDLTVSLGSIGVDHKTSTGLGGDYMGHEGSFNTNNGVLCAVTHDGEIIAGANTPRVRRIIEDEHLRPDSSLSVALSNGPDQVDDDTWGRFSRVATDAMFADQADKLGVNPANLNGSTIEGDWIAEPEIADDAGENSLEDKYGDDGERRFHEVGHFGANNGVISFVDGHGVKRVAPTTEGRIKSLKSAGYKEDGNVSVPLSNGQKLTNEHVAKQWENMLEVSPDDA